MQFVSGSVAEKEIPGSMAVQLMDKKRKFGEIMRSQLTNSEKGWLQVTLMQHFRANLNTRNFYCLPLSTMKQLPMQQLDLAVRSGLSIKGHGVQPSGLLPLTDAQNSLALTDRANAPVQKPFDSGVANSFLGCLTGDDSANVVADSASPADQKIVSYKAQNLGSDLEQLLESCQCDDYVVFRVSDMNPAKKKRPMASADNVQSHDLAIRFYNAVETENRGESIWVCQSAQSEVPLVQLFAAKDPNDIIANMWEMRIQEGVRPTQPNHFLLRRCVRVFSSRVVPFSLDNVDVEKGLKPSLFDLYLLLAERGWKYQKPTVSAARLKEIPIQYPGRKIYYQRSFWYFLVLLNMDKLQRCQVIFHGQIEAYYEAIFRLAARGPLSTNLL